MDSTIFKGKLFNAAAASAAHNSWDANDAATYMAPVDCGLYTYASFQCVWAGLTGTINATVTVMVSNDGTHWDVKSDSSGNPVVLTLSGASGHNTISLAGVVAEEFYGLAYAPGGVTGGTITANGIAKPA